MMVRNPAKDAVAIVGLGTTPYRRDAGGKSPLALACDAAVAALADCGLAPQDVDGVGATTVPSGSIQAALGVGEVGWWVNVTMPVSLVMMEAVNAVFSGACTTALVCHATYRGAGASRSAAADPFRVHAVGDAHGHNLAMQPETPSGTFGYCAWAGRYLHDAGCGREVFGRIAVNSRTNATRNPHALFREPLTMDEYLAGRMIREPLSIFDMDPPVDSGDAFVVTTAERARDLVDRPVYVHAGSLGRTGHPYADQLTDYQHTGKEIVADRLWAKSDLTLEDVDVFYPYDGFSIMAVSWFEAFGYCKTWEAPEFLADQWDDAGNRLLLDSRVPVNTHGGSLSEGATQGAGHWREAVDQLRGTAGDRQVDGASCALLAPGGFMWNATGFVLRA